jgi:Meiotically up-regulated gene 113
VPRDFEVLFEERVVDCDRAERLIHQRLHQHRSSTNREFFNVPLKDAIRVLNEAADDVGRVPRDTPVKPVHAPIDNITPSPQIAEIEVNVPAQKRQIKRSAPSTTRFEDHASFTDAQRRELLVDLRRRVWELDARLQQGEVCTPLQRIAYRVPGNKQFMEVKVQRAAFLLRLIDGDFPPDPGGIARLIPASHQWPFKLEIKVTTPAELQAAMPFVEAAYRAGLRG